MLYITFTGPSKKQTSGTTVALEIRGHNFVQDMLQ